MSRAITNYVTPLEMPRERRHLNVLRPASYEIFISRLLAIVLLISNYFIISLSRFFPPSCVRLVFVPLETHSSLVTRKCYSQSVTYGPLMILHTGAYTTSQVQCA